MLILISGIFINGCEENLVGDSFNTFGKLIPLEDGNSWEYLVTNYDSLGIVSSYFSYKDSVLSDTIINNDSWYKISNNNDYRLYRLFRNQIGGYYLYDSTKSSKESLVFKYPCEVGDTSIYTQVIRVNIKINVNSKEYNCIQYRQYLMNIKMQYFDYYISPGIGVVRIQNFENQNLLQDFSLIKLKI